MTTTSNDPTTARPGHPPVVDRATWRAARDELLVREKAHTRAGDALAAARRRLPMVEIDATTEVEGADGPVPFLDLFRGRDELVIYHHMWHDGAPHQGQCPGCTFNVWQMEGSAVYLHARGVSFAVLTSGRRDEVAPFVAFMGYTQPWYSVRGVEAPIATDEGHIVCYLRDGDRAFLTYSTTARGNEPADGVMGLLDMTPYGRGEAWEDNPEGRPEGRRSCWYWASDADGNATWGPTSRPAPQWTRPGATPVATHDRPQEGTIMVEHASPADEYREVAGRFTALVEAVPDDATWARPSPVPEWTARDVVGHLVDWFPGFLAGGAGVVLPPGPGVDDDPAGAWRALSDGVQALLDDPATGGAVLTNPHIGEIPLPEAVSRFFTADVFMHTWDLARATGQDATLDPERCARMLEGMQPLDELLRSSGQFGPKVEVPGDADAQTRMLAFIGRDPR